MNDLTPEEKERRIRQYLAYSERLKSQQKNQNQNQNENPQNALAFKLSYQTRPTNRPDFPHKQANIDDVEYKKRIEAYLALERKRFLNSLKVEERNRFEKSLRIVEGQLMFTGENRHAAVAAYLQFNPAANISLHANNCTQNEVKEEIKALLQEENNNNMPGKIIAAIADIQIVENGKKRILTGKEKDDFINNIVRELQQTMKPGEQKINPGEQRNPNQTINTDQTMNQDQTMNPDQTMNLESPKSPQRKSPFALPSTRDGLKPHKE